MSPPLVGTIRRVVAHTGDWPGLSSAYELTYRLTVRRLARATRDLPGAAALLLRGSARGSITPGLSDIDAFVVLEPGIGAAEQVATVVRLRAAVDAVNRPAPLVRDVHVVSLDELAGWARLAVYLLGALHVDATPLWGRVELPPPARGREVVARALRRGVAWWTDRGLRQVLLEPGPVGRRLAARSFRKASRFADALAAAPDEITPTMRTYNTPALDAPATAEDAVRALRRLDAAVPDAPHLEVDRAGPHPSLRDTAAPIAAWLTPLTREAAWGGAVLSTEGASRADLRLFLVLDPEHPRAPDALRALACHLARSPLPHRPRFSRCPFPIVVTPRQAARSVWLRWTALEPVARLRHGHRLFGEVPAPRATRGEILDSLAYEAVHLLGGARELLAVGGPSAADRLRDLSDNVVEAHARALEGEWSTVPTRPFPSSGGSAARAFVALHPRVEAVRDPLLDAAIDAR